MDFLIKWWNILSPLKKLIYGYIILGVLIYLITSTFNLITSITHYPEQKYYCWYEKECGVGEFVVNIYLILPVVMLMYMTYGFIFEPYEYVRMFDLSFDYLFLILLFLFIISIPLAIGFYFKKTGKIKPAYAFFGLFAFILIYLASRTIYFYLTFPNP